MTRIVVVAVAMAGAGRSCDSTRSEAPDDPAGRESMLQDGWVTGPETDIVLGNTVDLFGLASGPGPTPSSSGDGRTPRLR